MSPRVSRSHDAPDDEPEEPPGLPPGYVPTRPPVTPRPAPRLPLPRWGRVVGLVVLLATTVGVIVYLALPDDPRKSAQGTADLVAAALSAGDTSAFVSYTCYPDEVKLDDGWARVGRTTVLAVSNEKDGVATATLTISHPGNTDVALLMRSENDGPWCVVTPSLCPLAGSSSPSPLDMCAHRPGRS